MQLFYNPTLVAIRFSYSVPGTILCEHIIKYAPLSYCVSKKTLKFMLVAVKSFGWVWIKVNSKAVFKNVESFTNFLSTVNLQ